jgi:thioesterase domain-containing protein
MLNDAERAALTARLRRGRETVSTELTRGSPSSSSGAGSAADAPGRDARLVVALGGTPDLPPLFLVHAIAGTVYGYLPLAKELGETYRVYGIEASGTRPATTPATSINEMVAKYVDEIRAAQPTGPYRVGGWSMGGVVAYEMTRSLVERGEEVDLLALLDAPFAFPDEPVTSEAQLAAFFVADAAGATGLVAARPPDPACGSATEQLEWLAAQLGDDAGGELMRELQRRFEVFSAHARLLVGYRPVTKVRARTLLLVGARYSINVAAFSHWPEVLEGEVSSVAMDCHHYSLLQPPQVRQVAELLMGLCPPPPAP